jgi:hypothetical protein
MAASMKRGVPSCQIRIAKNPGVERRPKGGTAAAAKAEAGAAQLKGWGGGGAVGRAQAGADAGKSEGGGLARNFIRTKGEGVLGMY